MSWVLYRTDTFLRTARKFLKRHPDLRPELADLLAQLEQDPLAPRLRLHPLHGPHAGKHAVSFTYSLRVVLSLKVEDRKVFLLDVGSHDEVYR